MSANDVDQAARICRRALQQLDQGYSQEFEAILSGHSQLIARALVEAADTLRPPPVVAFPSQDIATYKFDTSKYIELQTGKKPTQDSPL